MTKTILVTGANRGIGLEIVKQYAKAGDTVLACCRNPDKADELQQLHQTNHKIHVHQLDVGDENNIKQLAARLKNTAIDILFNNAGVAGEDVSFEKINYEDLLSTLKVNTLGPVMLSQALLSQLDQGHSKTIVNLSSVLGSIELNQDASWKWFSYRISKSALNSATKCIANQLKTKNIIAIAVSPGWVQTDMGGPNADITVEQSVNGIRNIIEKITLKDSGHFLSYDGKQLPW